MPKLSKFSPEVGRACVETGIEHLLWMTNAQFRHLRTTEQKIDPDTLEWFILLVEEAQK